MTLESAINRFLQHLASERNLAPRTVEAYGYDLRRFLEFIQADGKPVRVEKLEPFDLKNYLAEMKDSRDLKPSTLSRTISSLRVFFEYLSSMDYIPGNPARTLHNPKNGRKLPVYLTPEETRDVLERQATEEKDPLRDQTILMLLTMSGMRLSEIVGLNCEDVDFHDGTIRVLGKGRKERLIPMNQSVRKALRDYLAARPPGRDGCRSLFLGRHGGRISRRTIQYLVKKTAKALGLDPRLSPHKLRHTFATTLLSQHVDLRDIQELLGHSNIASTSVYTHTNVEKVRAAVDKLKLE